MANGTLAASQIEMLSQDGTGIITITPPATNTNRAITLPDSTGTVATAESTLAQFNASGSAPVYAARAWVNFNGTGTVAIRASGNVSSITDNGTGDYTVNFTTAMPDANYSFTAGPSANLFMYENTDGGILNRTTSSIRISQRTAGNVLIDSISCSISIFR
jgi:hypothetical protein